MLTQIIRWLKGYLKIQLIGYSPERFINICKNKNIFVWDLKSFQNHYEMYIRLEDFKKLKPLCKKTVSKVRITDRVGLPFIIYNLRKRNVFVAGLILSIILIYLSSFRIWSIDIRGNQKLTYDVICTYLRKQSIESGTSKLLINCKNLASDLRKEFEDIIWVSVSLDGTKLIIELRENTDSEIIQRTDNSPTDLVAKFDGIITSIVTRNGVPMVQVGDEVQKGDVLVSGSVPVMNDSKEIVSTKFVKADADILGEQRVNYQDLIAAFYQKKQYIKESIYLKIPENKDNKEIFINHGYFSVGSIKEYKLINTNYTENEREVILENNYIKYCERLISEDIIIKESHFIITHSNSKSIAVSNLLIEQPIEESRKIIDLSSENMLQ